MIFTDTRNAADVRRAAKFLDEVKPGWATLIDTDLLDIENGADCILGQAFSAEAEHSGLSSGYNYALSDSSLNEDLYGYAFFDNISREFWVEEIRDRVGS